MFRQMHEQFPEPDSPEGHRADSGALQGELASAHAQLAAMREQLEEAGRDRLAASEREKWLQSELQHRVRNMLAIIRSVFSRTVESGHSLEDLSDHFSGRLDALARFQIVRGASADGASDLENMIRDELQSFEFDDRIEIRGPDVAIPNDAAQALQLALHELATNALKFGALAHPDARTGLAIEWTFTEGVLTLNWVETGVPVLAAAPVRSGFGREYIEHALPYQLGAATRFDLLPGGLSCTIMLRVPDGDATSSAGAVWR